MNKYIHTYVYTYTYIYTYISYRLILRPSHTMRSHVKDQEILITKKVSSPRYSDYQEIRGYLTPFSCACEREGWRERERERGREKGG